MGSPSSRPPRSQSVLLWLAGSLPPLQLAQPAGRAPVPSVGCESGGQAGLAYGGTSGRFTVAEIVSHIFPALCWCAEAIEKGWRAVPDPAEFPSLPLGLYRRDRTVEYLTPERTEGLGSLSRLAASGRTIAGAIGLLLTESFDVWRLAIRLPRSLRSLRQSILDIAVTDAPRWPKN